MMLGGAEVFTIHQEYNENYKNSDSTVLKNARLRARDKLFACAIALVSLHMACGFVFLLVFIDSQEAFGTLGFGDYIISTPGWPRLFAVYFIWQGAMLLTILMGCIVSRQIAYFEDIRGSSDKSEFFRVWQSIRVGFCVLFLFHVCGALIFHFIEGWSIIDSIYFSATTLSTITFGDFTPASGAGQVAVVIFFFTGVVWSQLVITQIGTGLMSLAEHLEVENDSKILNRPAIPSANEGGFFDTDPLNAAANGDALKKDNENSEVIGRPVSYSSLDQNIVENDTAKEERLQKVLKSICAKYKINEEELKGEHGLSSEDILNF